MRAGIACSGAFPVVIVFGDGEWWWVGGVGKEWQVHRAAGKFSARNLNLFPKLVEILGTYRGSGEHAVEPRAGGSCWVGFGERRGTVLVSIVEGGKGGTVQRPLP